MKKRIIPLLLCVILLVSFGGCSLFGEENRNENFGSMEQVDKMQTDFDTTGVILEDAIPYYSDRNDLQNTQLGMLYKGDQVWIYYREISNGEDWVFTDKGWICGTYVQTRQVGGQITGELAGICNARAALDLLARETPDYDGKVVCGYSADQQIFVECITPGESGMWGYTMDGWVPMCDVIMDDVGAPGVAAMEVLTEVTQRTGPGVEYEAVGVAAPGLVLITDLAEVHGILWGEVDDAVWICMDFVGTSMQLMNTDGTIFVAQRNRDPAEYTGQGYDPYNPGSQDNQGDQGDQGNQGDLTQQPNNTALVGQWVCFDEENFLRTGEITTESWTFNADGTFSRGDSEHMYFSDRGGWYGASGGWGWDGIYTYDGSMLVLQADTVYDGGEVYHENVYQATACMVNGNYAEWIGQAFYRAEDVNGAIRDTVRRNAQSYVKSDVVGVWNSESSGRMELRDDGTFADDRGSGRYLYVNDLLFLVYDDDYIGCKNVSLKGNVMDASFMQDWTTVTVSYTKE